MSFFTTNAADEQHYRGGNSSAGNKATVKRSLTTANNKGDIATLSGSKEQRQKEEGGYSIGGKSVSGKSGRPELQYRRSSFTDILPGLDAFRNHTTAAKYKKGMLKVVCT